MIVRQRLHWLRMLFVWRGSVLGRILPQLCATTFAAGIVSTIEWFEPGRLPNLTPVPFTLLGIALAIFLGFRNSVSYDRYWEARTLWGTVLNDTRSLARQIATLCDVDLELRTCFIHGLVAFVRGLRAQLRGVEAAEALKDLLPIEASRGVTNARFVPAMVLLSLGEQLATLRRTSQTSPILIAEMDRRLVGLTDALGGCERISSTPIPFAYSVILHRTAYLYSFLLPFGLVSSIGMMTPLIVAFVSYTFFALEALAEELQDPFGKEPNDLPLDAIASMIEATLREMNGETRLPPVPQPVDHILT